MGSDVLYGWMSENRRGSLRYLRDRICWYMGAADAPNPRRAAGLWIRDVVTRGHLSVDWTSDQWQVPTTVLTTLPGRFGLALLSGGRPKAVENRLMEAMQQEDLSIRIHSSPPDGKTFVGPSTVFVEFRCSADLDEAARYLGVHLRYDAFKTIAQQLHHVRTGPPTSGPVRSGASLERWDSDSMSFAPFVPTNTWPSGMYREKVNGTNRHVLRDQEEWYACDLAAGKYLAANRGDGLIRWRPDSEGAEVGSTFVDSGASLPDAHRLALGLCTGLPPVVLRQTQSTRYDNVPLNVAQKVGSTLYQDLQFIEPSASPRSFNV